MPFDPLAFAIAASFTAGCASIHALRFHADCITLVLGLSAYALATALASLLAARSGLISVPDPVAGWAFGAAPIF
jgi:hypothetical protein